MNADQLIEGIGNAVAAAKPAQEYCFLGCQHWSMCMTKSEWSGWAQAIGATLAIIISILIIFKEIRERNEDRREARVKELRMIRLVLDRNPLESNLSNFLGTFSGLSKRYPNESDYMKNFNSIFVFAHTIKQFNKLLDCIDEMPNNDMETLKLSFVGDEVRRIIIDVAFMSSIYKGFGESVVGFEFLKEVVTSKKFFENIQLLENKVKNIEEELQPQFSMLKEAFTSLYENHSALNKKLYGAVV